MFDPQETAWRDVVAVYLRALWEDARAEREQRFSNAQAEFLRRFGGETVQREYHEFARGHLDAILEPPPESTWTIVEKSNDRVVVEVNVSEHGVNPLRVPFINTRLRLAWCEGTWRITHVFRACYGCNMHSLAGPGECFCCKGTGEQPFRVKRRGSWWRKERVVMEPSRCEFCGGSGRCQDCAEGEAPGWTSTFFLPRIEDALRNWR